MALYNSKRFKPFELVDKATYESFADKSLSDIYDLFDWRLLKAIDDLMDKLEEHYKKSLKIICNNWKWHKNPKAPDYFQWRGLRNEKCKGYSAGSQHNYIKSVRKVTALDFDVFGIKAEDVRNFIVEHQNEDWAKIIGGLEDDVNWVHLDIRSRLSNKIIQFGKPNKKKV